MRGEKAAVYLNGGARRSVCELCQERALHEGWIREGTTPAYSESDLGSDRRRSLLGRLRARRDNGADAAPRNTFADGYDERPVPEARPARQSRSSRRDAGNRRPDRVREPRHVRAVPTSIEQKVASAIDLFNSSEHPRTVAGVARSLGMPTVSVAPSATRASQVKVVVSWELCWYRYEVDLSDDQPSVRVVEQGYELEDLEPEELQANAVADERGYLSI